MTLEVFFSNPLFALILTGLVSGFVDSIAGGGGLINLPVLMLLIGPGASAIGTNKVSGVLAALVALLVYIRNGAVDLKKSIVFTLWVGAGSLLGSQIAPLLPSEIFRYFLLGTCPLILWVVWNKNIWIAHQKLSHPPESGQTLKTILSGLACGIYDGVWGPGGGTFMFLALLLFAKLPLFTALAASKMANTFSAGVALVSYGSQGYVHWKEGAVLATSASLGAFLGAKCATHKTHQIVRPVLALISGLLLWKVLI